MLKLSDFDAITFDVYGTVITGKFTGNFANSGPPLQFSLILVAQSSGL